MYSQPVQCNGLDFEILCGTIPPGRNDDFGLLHRALELTKGGNQLAVDRQYHVAVSELGRGWRPGHEACHT